MHQLIHEKGGELALKERGKDGALRKGTGLSGSAKRMGRKGVKVCREDNTKTYSVIGPN